MKSRAEHPNRQRIANELRKGAPLTKFDLELRCHLSVRNVNAYLKVMHEAGDIHIHGYRRDTPHGPPTTVWAWGTGKDAKKPRPRTYAEIARSYRKRNPEAVIREIKRKRRQRELAREHCNGIRPDVGVGGTRISLLWVRSLVGED